MQKGGPEDFGTASAYWLGRLARSPRQGVAANNNTYYSENHNNDEYANHRYDGGAAKEEGACERSAHAGTYFRGKCWHTALLSVAKHNRFNSLQK